MSFDGGVVGSGGVIDVDDLLAAQQAPDVPSSSWLDGAKGLGAIALIVAVLVGGLYLLSQRADSGDEPSRDAAESADADSAGADAAGTDGESGELSDADGAAGPESTVRPSPIGELLEGLDVGTRWVVAKNRAARYVVHDLETGAVYDAGVGRALDSLAVWLLDEGFVTYDLLSLPQELTYQRWGTAGEPVRLDGTLVATFRDPDVGRVLVAAQPGPTFELVALAVETGERQAVELHPGLFGGAGSWVAVGGAQTLQGLAFVSSFDGDVWSWTWRGGWKRLTEGTVQYVHQDQLVVRTCSSPKDCRYLVVDHDGAVVNDSIEWESRARGGLSPDGRTRLWFRAPDFFGSQPTDQGDAGVVLSDVASGDEVLAVGMGEFDQWQWSPNGRFLVLSDYERTTVIDTSEGDTVGVTPSRMITGPGGSFGGAANRAFAFISEFEPPEPP